MIFITLAALGIVLSLVAYVCVDEHIENKKDARLFGRMHWSLIGVIGYTLILFTRNIPMATYLLIGITALVTLWLAVKAFKIKLGCPICPMLWTLNTALVFMAVL